MHGPDVPDDFDKDKEESLKILNARLSRKIAHKYRPFGIQLLNDPGIISDIESRVTNVQNYLLDTLTRWSDKQEGDLPLQGVLDAIRSPAIGNPKLAKELEEEWTKNGLCKLSFHISITNNHNIFYLQCLPQPMRWKMINWILTELRRIFIYLVRVVISGFLKHFLFYFSHVKSKSVGLCVHMG